MKKTRYIKGITFAAMIFILLLQGIWIMNVYNLMESQLRSQIIQIFDLSINKELKLRMRMNQQNITEYSKNDTTFILSSEEDKWVGSNVDIIQDLSLVMQEYTTNINRPLSVKNLDSIFHTEIYQQNISGNFIINRLNPKTGEILETTDSLRKGTLRGALASEIVPIRIDGSEGVQALLVSPYRAIFKKMIYILLLSLLLAVFVWYAIFFLLRSFTAEKRLRQFQTDFSHALTHDMASPLQTIYQVNTMMKNDKFAANPEKRNKYIDIAQQQIVNLQSLIDRILTIARSEESRLVPEISNVDIIEVVHKLVAKFSLQSKKDVTVTSECIPEKISFPVDESMFYNAISNLIDNSIKYSGKSVQIHIDCRLKENGLHIGVKDNGYGISERNQAIIFAKFERGAAVTRKEAKGFGLGLAYVKSVAEVHGGTVNLYSEEKKGSLFELFIPFERKQETTDTEKSKT